MATIFALLLMWLPQETPCNSEMIPISINGRASPIDENEARRIARSAILSQTRPRAGTYTLNVIVNAEDRGQWLVFETVPDRPNMRGGGGFQMRIDRCTGFVSGISRQR